MPLLSLSPYCVSTLKVNDPIVSTYNGFAVVVTVQWNVYHFLQPAK